MERHPILQQSFALIDLEAGALATPSWAYQVARRVVHATGDMEYLHLLEFRRDVLRTACALLRARRPVVVDSRMTLEGVRSHCPLLGIDPVCALDASVPASGGSRLEAAVERAVAHHPGALVVVGTSPQALRGLCDAVEERRVQVGAVVGMPVGFVGVHEAKRRLLQLPVPSLVSLGRKGGSAAAAAAVNALVELVQEMPSDPQPDALAVQDPDVVHVIGLGAGGVEELPATLRARVARAQVLAGGERHLALAESWAYSAEERIVLRGDLEEAVRRVDAHRRAGLRTVVLLSGDPLFYGLGAVLLRHLPRDAVVCHPALSSVQLAFARLRVPWQGATIVSLHGRILDLLEPALEAGATPLAVLPGPERGPREIARRSLRYGPYRIHVLEHLGTAQERVRTMTPEEALRCESFAPLSVVVLTREPAPVPLGLPESAFSVLPDRPGMITKAEVRVLTLSRLQVRSGHVVYDVGAGTGSVSVELALLVPGATIYAVERRSEAAAVLQENMRRHSLPQVRVVRGEAPEALRDLPEADRVFVGGSGGRLGEILEEVATKLRSGGILVLNLSAVESVGHAASVLRGWGWQVDILDVHLSRSAECGGRLVRRPLGPVTIVRGVKP